MRSTIACNRGIAVVVALACCSPTWASVTWGKVVIGEFRLRGPNGASDEFVELFNAAPEPVDVSGWKVKGSSASGTVGVRATLPSATILPPGCHYLLANSSGPYSGVATPDLTYSSSITDDGGIALTLPNDTIVDQVGMSAASAFKEGMPLVPLTLNQDRGYERRPGALAGNGTDSDDNTADFGLVAPTGPQNSTSACVTQAIPTATVSASPTATSTASFTPTDTATATPSETATETATESPSSTPTTTPTPSVTATTTPSETATTSATESPSSTPTATPSLTATATASAVHTPQPTESPTHAPTATASTSPSPSLTPSAPPTATSTPSPTNAATATTTALPACGNGQVDSGEHCDDGNHIDGDDCPATCDFGRAGQLIRGNRAPASENQRGCLAEWQLRTSKLAHDPHGMPDLKQSCRDQDPTCDNDPAVGNCRVQVRLCLDNNDIYLPTCSARVSLLRVLAPRSDSVMHRRNRLALQSAMRELPPLAYANPTRCTRPFAIDIDLTGRSVVREQLLLRLADEETGSPGYLSRLIIECRTQR